MTEPVLYIVATPIGTLADFSPRAREVLAQCDFVACEDTRHSGRLFAHFGIRVPLESLHDHNEVQKSQFLIQKLKTGANQCAAIVTDAGTPAVSDPGARFVAEAAAQGVRVLNVPGPSSLVCALAASGFLQPRILFSGFLPRSRNEQFAEFARWKKVAPCIAVFFESPQRMLSSLVHLNQFFDTGTIISVCASREISKHYEEHVRGSPSEVHQILAARESVQGEFAVSIELAFEAAPDQVQLTLEQAAVLALEWAEDRKKTLKEISKDLAATHHLSAKELYNKAQELKK